MVCLNLTPLKAFYKIFILWLSLLGIFGQGMPVSGATCKKKTWVYQVLGGFQAASARKSVPLPQAEICSNSQLTVQEPDPCFQVTPVITVFTSVYPRLIGPHWQNAFLEAVYNPPRPSILES